VNESESVDYNRIRRYCDLGRRGPGRPRRGSWSFRQAILTLIANGDFGVVGRRKFNVSYAKGAEGKSAAPPKTPARHGIRNCCFGQTGPGIKEGGHPASHAGRRLPPLEVWRLGLPGVAQDWWTEIRNRLPKRGERKKEQLVIAKKEMENRKGPLGRSVWGWLVSRLDGGRQNGPAIARCPIFSRRVSLPVIGTVWGPAMMPRMGGDRGRIILRARAQEPFYFAGSAMTMRGFAPDPWRGDGVWFLSDTSARAYDVASARGQRKGPS